MFVLWKSHYAPLLILLQAPFRVRSLFVQMAALDGAVFLINQTMTMKYQHIFFDCDSTLLQIETLEHLAVLKGVGKEVADLTERSMNGELPLEEAMPQKMDLLAPHADDITRLYKNLDSLITPGTQKLLNHLREEGVEVYILTNNFVQVVEPVAVHLGIPKENIFANTMFQSETGVYAGIDRNGVLGTSTGKAEILRAFCEDHEGVVHVGDSVSDLACQGIVDLFIGFGGVVVRKAVEENAEKFVYKNDLLALHEYL